jgi:hypothetical protein
MLTASLRRTAVLVSLIAVLATSGVSAAGPQIAGVRPVLSTGELLDRILSFLRPHLKEDCHIDMAQPTHTKEGCKLDPDGRCQTSMAQPPHTEEGCKLDPNGRCYASMAQPPYTSCKLDPNGFCIP